MRLTKAMLSNAYISDEGDSNLEGVVKNSPWQTFYERCTLTESDRAELREKRGLSDDMISAAGFKSNQKGYFQILQDLAKDYPEWELVGCGLWKSKQGELKPSAQFYGYGVISKKRKLSAEQLEDGEFDDLEDDDFAWGWKEDGKCNPVLIPYFDLKGELIRMRPHKGFPKGQKPRLYIVPRIGGKSKPRRAVITEGEFKAAALQDVVGPEWTVAAVPGITFVKNYGVWGDIIAWLKNSGVKDVVVAFDNENKGDPKSPNYQPKADKRFDAMIWARVCAIRLDREGFAARVAYLPDKWRDQNQKCDWDSALADMRRTGKTQREIQNSFEGVLRTAIQVDQFAKSQLFSKADEQMISDRAASLAYEPALPWGGEREQKLAEELRKLALGPLRENCGQVLALAEAYKKTKGWYFELKISELRRETLFKKLSSAEGAHEIAFLNHALKGTPELVSPIHVEPVYVLVKPNGNRDRLVRLNNTKGERSELVALDATSFTSSRDWREWVLQRGNYGWEGGDRSLQALQRDINHQLARREVKQLVCYGCERPGELWIADDCAFTPDGAIIVPDKEGVFWHKGLGYTFLRDNAGYPQGEEGQSFRLKSKPRFHPELGLAFDGQGKLHLRNDCEDDITALEELLGSFAIVLNKSFGGHAGTMLIGAILGFMAGPEIFALRNEFPGVWITGEKGSGKTYTAKWLLGLHGWSEIESGASFKTSTSVGVQIAIGQYANMPVWGDEYKENELKDENIKGVIHSGFNREVNFKWSQDGNIRAVRTNFLVTGETTCLNAATMSRFVTVVAAREKRSGTKKEMDERLQWMQDHRSLLFTIGRKILTQRERFAKLLLEYLSLWGKMSELGEVDSRAIFSYGVSFAAFRALNEIIPVMSDNECEKFREWLIERTISSDQAVAVRVSVNEFFADLVSALANDAFGSKKELKGLFKVMKSKTTSLHFSEIQTKDGIEHPRKAWTSYNFFFRPGPVIDLLRKYKREQGQSLPLDQGDLLEQMKVKDFFVPGRRQGHHKKFGQSSRQNQYCWCIDLDKFLGMGFREVSDEEWQNSKYRDENSSNELLPFDEWTDPRKGELFAFVDALMKGEDGDEGFHNSIPSNSRQTKDDER